MIPHDGPREKRSCASAGLTDRVLKAEGEARAVEAARGEVLGISREFPL